MFALSSLTNTYQFCLCVKHTTTPNSYNFRLKSPVFIASKHTSLQNVGRRGKYMALIMCQNLRPVYFDIAVVVYSNVWVVFKQQ